VSLTKLTDHVEKLCMWSYILQHILVVMGTPTVGGFALFSVSLLFLKDQNFF